MEQTTAIGSFSQSRTQSSISKYFVYFFLSAGLIVSVYLLYRYKIVLSNTAGKGDVCSAIFGKGCDSALRSKVSNQFGLPLAAWGFIYYVLLAVLLFAAKVLRNSFQNTANLMALTFSFVGCLVSLTLLCMMIIDPSLFCPLCVTLHVINLLLFLGMMKMINISQDDFFEQLKSEGKAIFASRGKAASVKRFGLAALLLLITVLYFGFRVFAQNAVATSSNFNPQKAIAQYEAAEFKKIPIESGDPVLGEMSSPIEMIVFSDFQCSGCAFFSAAVKELNKRYPGKIHLIYKYFPLGLACNNTIKENIHPRACEAAWAAEAARQQGKFWEFHDALYIFNLEAGRKTVCSIADSLGLDHSKFETYRISEAARKKTSQTVALAKQLGVLETPAIYINGKLAPDFKFKPLEAVVRHILNLPPQVYKEEKEE